MDTTVAFFLSSRIIIQSLYRMFMFYLTNILAFRNFHHIASNLPSSTIKDLDNRFAHFIHRQSYSKQSIAQERDHILQLFEKLTLDWNKMQEK
jgi:hypothetical protein